MSGEDDYVGNDIPTLNLTLSLLFPGKPVNAELGLDGELVPSVWNEHFYEISSSRKADVHVSDKDYK